MSKIIKIDITKQITLKSITYPYSVYQKNFIYTVK